MPQTVTTLQPTNVADLLDRILDKGVVIVGDIKIDLVDVELLTIKIRLLIASVDKAKSIGINWWEGDSFLKATDLKEIAAENEALKKRVASLEKIS
ncbi:MAG: gas vesicle protein [Ktedonobacteraceae bacterium]|nr:gas vesicle protein [Ktedonobacteraceae bacterium]